MLIWDLYRIFLWKCSSKYVLMINNCQELLLYVIGLEEVVFKEMASDTHHKVLSQYALSMRKYTRYSSLLLTGEGVWQRNQQLHHNITVLTV